ncbi:MAG: hypothetical protein FWG20_04945 [Candidatus Cloacimonetes bacterium]|nr:hypothetical protein [Candidatus Cloacimonadota bacterium]
MNKEDRSGLAPLNLKILLSGVIVIIVGFIIMATGDRTLSPILLIVAFLGIIPFGLLYKVKQ